MQTTSFSLRKAFSIGRPAGNDPTWLSSKREKSSKCDQRQSLKGGHFNIQSHQIEEELESHPDPPQIVFFFKENIKKASIVTRNLFEKSHSAEKSASISYYRNVLESWKGGKMKPFAVFQMLNVFLNFCENLDCEPNRNCLKFLHVLASCQRRLSWFHKSPMIISMH